MSNLSEVREKIKVAQYWYDYHEKSYNEACRNPSMQFACKRRYDDMTAAGRKLDDLRAEESMLIRLLDNKLEKKNSEGNEFSKSLVSTMTMSTNAKRISIRLGFLEKRGTATIDWGDSTKEEYMNRSSYNNWITHDYSNASTHTISIAGKNITTLSCSDNQLTSLDVSENTELTVLSCTGNQLTNLNVRENTKLVNLYCANNLLKSLDVSKNTIL